MNPLSHSIHVVILWHLRNEFNELILVDKHTASGVKENISSRFSYDRKGKCRLVRPRELQVDALCIRLNETLAPSWHNVLIEDILASVAAVEVCRLDHDPHSMRTLDVQLEGEGLDVGSVDVALLLVNGLPKLPFHHFHSQRLQPGPMWP